MAAESRKSLQYNCVITWKGTKAYIEAVLVNRTTFPLNRSKCKTWLWWWRNYDRNVGDYLKVDTALTLQSVRFFRYRYVSINKIIMASSNYKQPRMETKSLSSTNALSKCTITRCVQSRTALIHKENQTRCNSISKFYFVFMWSSTCFRRHTVHHQEPKTTSSLWFCIRGGLLDV
jgi:hypothetical protein